MQLKMLSAEYVNYIKNSQSFARLVLHRQGIHKFGSQKRLNYGRILTTLTHAHKEEKISITQN